MSFYETDTVTIHHGDCLDVMRELPDGSVDAIVTDPPYGLGFMGKAWDDLPPGEEWAGECLRVLKPGGHLLAFGGSRTWHRLAVAVEDAGFEIRDSIAWLHGQGFPKGKAVLKPAFEPIVVGRKPLDGTAAANVLAHGTGALNIDACRVGTDGGRRRGDEVPTTSDVYTGPTGYPKPADLIEGLGRWPTNVVLEDSQAAELDRQSGISVSPSRTPVQRNRTTVSGALYSGIKNVTQEVYGYDDQGGASRFFPTFRYVAKAPTRERPKVDGVAHPTVKPLELMRWLVRLATPSGGVVLDPFAGSGTTVEACILEGFQCVAIEREAEYLPLILHRIERAS